MTMNMTDEQVKALDLFRTGEHLVIEAGAGTGKTSTLVGLAFDAQARGLSGQYVAFNKGIVQDAGAALPSNVAANTAHSLAFRAVGNKYGHRLRANGRMRSSELARALAAKPLKLSGSYLGAGLIASIATMTVVRFCQSADPEITIKHVPFQDGLGNAVEGKPDWAAQDALKAHVLPVARKIWRDALDTYGTLPYRHDYYLKAWELDDPQLGVDIVLFDEAQDASPVLKSAVEKQKSTQLVFVGDSAQQIYGFTGAINALADLEGNRTMLTNSFRFGPRVAAVANEFLSALGSDMQLVGAGPDSTVGAVNAPDCVLARTNATTVTRFFAAKQAGLKPHLVGGGAQIISFARAATDLQTRGWTQHPDLACFKSWEEVEAYVTEDAQGEDLGLMVRVVNTFGAQALITQLQNMTPANKADLVISTAHKSKGLAWRSVQLAGDFKPRGKREDDDNRLLYVAVTRAKQALDIDQLDREEQA